MKDVTGMEYNRIHAQGSENTASEQNFATLPSEETQLSPQENVIPHCAVLLVLDTSHNMWGSGLRDVMRALENFCRTIRSEQFLNARIEVAPSGWEMICGCWRNLFHWNSHICRS